MFCPSLAFKHRRPTPGQSLPQTLQPLQRQRETRTRFGAAMLRRFQVTVQSRHLSA